MSLFDLIMIGISLSMDAFAVSICKGLSVRKVQLSHALICGAWFGALQAIMPSFGYFLGSRFEHLLNSVGPWVTFILLAVIGVNMVRESFGGDETVDNDFSAKAMLPLAVATSIDAFAVGVGFAAMEANIVVAALLIGCTPAGVLPALYALHRGGGLGQAGAWRQVGCYHGGEPVRRGMAVRPAGASGRRGTVLRHIRNKSACTEKASVQALIVCAVFDIQERQRIRALSLNRLP